MSSLVVPVFHSQSEGNIRPEELLDYSLNDVFRTFGIERHPRITSLGLDLLVVLSVKDQ